MKKAFSIIIAIVMVLTIAAGFTGCSSSISAPALVAEQTETEREVTVSVSPTILVWADNSTSAQAEAEAITAEAERLVAAGAYGPYPFSGGATGAETSNGWTGLATPVAASPVNSIIYIVTDGEMDAPGADPRQWVGPWNGRDVRFVCLRKDDNTEQLVDALRANPGSFQGSSVRIDYLDGSEAEVIYDGFVPMTAEGTVTDQDTLYELSTADPEPDNAPGKIRKSGFPWWLLGLLLGLALLGLILWWLLNRRREEHTEPAGTATPTTVAEKPVEPDRVVADPAPTATTPAATAAPVQTGCPGCCRCCWCPMRGPMVAIAIAAAIFAVAVAAAVVVMAVALL